MVVDPVRANRRGYRNIPRRNGKDSMCQIGRDLVLLHPLPQRGFFKHVKGLRVKVVKVCV